MVENGSRENLSKCNKQHEREQDRGKRKPPCCDGGVHFGQAAQRGREGVDHAPSLLRSKIEARLDSEVALVIARNAALRAVGQQVGGVGLIGKISADQPHTPIAIRV